VTPPQSTTAALSDLGWALGVVSRAYLRAITRVLDDQPGGLRGYQVLVAAAHGKPRSQAKLAQLLGVDRTAMTYLIDDLERAGFIERKPDPGDRRSRQITITETGSQQLTSLGSAVRAAEDDVLAPLDAADRSTFRSLLHGLTVQHIAEIDAWELVGCQNSVLGR
jgi:DNA-binding MarR family transcriptional regulator